MDEVLKEMADAKDIPYDGATAQPEIEPTVERNVVGDYLFTWETTNGEYIRVKCADAGFVRGELQVKLSVEYKKYKGSKPRTLLSRKRWILESDSSTTPKISTLRKWEVSVNWLEILTFVSDYFANNYESGDPLVWLDEVEDPGPLSYLVKPLVQAGEHTLVGAKGGSLKSMTGLALCLTVATGRSIIPGLDIEGEPAKCLYLDYETNKSTHRRRLNLIANAKGISIPPQMIGYKRLTTPLVQMKSELQQLIALQGFQFVVIDSVGRAVGGETVGEADVQAYYNACSAFNTTILSIGHTSKSSENTVAGNAQWEFQARSMWIFEAAKEHGSNAVVVGMHHRKVNEGELLPSLNYAVTFGESGLSYAQAEDADVEQLKGVDLKVKVRIYLGQNPNSTAKEIAQALDETPQRITNCLNTWKGREWESDGTRPAKWMLFIGMNTQVNDRVEGGTTYPPTSPHVEVNRGMKTEGMKNNQWWLEDNDDPLPDF